MARQRRFPKGLALILALAAVVGAQYWTDLQRQESQTHVPAAGPAEAAFSNRQSGVWMEVEGEVSRLLSDDEQGDRHQRFILTLPSGHTLLVAHNIDIAQRIPLAAGDSVTIRGRYEWNDKGGLLHWTHHDPDGDILGGWIYHDNVRYR